MCLGCAHKHFLPVSRPLAGWTLVGEIRSVRAPVGSEGGEGERPTVLTIASSSLPTGDSDLVVSSGPALGNPSTYPVSAPAAPWPGQPTCLFQKALTYSRVLSGKPGPQHALTRTERALKGSQCERGFFRHLSTVFSRSGETNSERGSSDVGHIHLDLSPSSIRCQVSNLRDNS